MVDTAGTLILGLGNLVHADDGLGVHVIERLMQDPRVPPDVRLFDGGTQGLALLPHVSGYRRMIVVDAVDAGMEPGMILRYEGSMLQGLPGKPSVHQLGFADMMIALEMMGERPQEAVLIGVQPLSTDWSPDLTPTVARTVDKVIELVFEQLGKWAEEPADERATLGV